MSMEYILGKHLNGENVAQILNIAKLTLANAAVGNTEVVRLGEMNAEIDALQTQIDTINADQTRISTVHVDTTSADLTTALSLGTYDGTAHTWTFGDGTVVGEGDAIILQAATAPEDRSWIHVGGTAGTASDFERLNSDIQALIDAGVQSVLDALRDGVPENYDTLNELYNYIAGVETTLTTVSNKADANETAITALTSDLATKTSGYVVDATFSDSGNGYYEATAANGTASASAIVTVKEDVGGGQLSTVPHSSYVDLVTESTVTLRTLAPSYNGKAVKVVIHG